jgi:hypothetical protein
VLLTTDTPAWNAVWAAFLVVAALAWCLGAWLLPALGIRPTTDLRFTQALTQLPGDALQPEPLEQQRYLLAMLAALTVVPCAHLIAGRRALNPVVRWAPLAGLLAVLTIATVSIVHGHGLADRYFAMGPVLAIVAGAVVAAFAFLAIFAGRARWAVLALDRLSRRRPAEAIILVLVVAIAFGVTAVGIYTDSNVLFAPGQTAGHMQYTFEESTAVFYGRTPLVDFTPQYTTLLPWLLWPLFLIKAPSIALFTDTMAALGMAALLCLYFTYRLVTGTAARALLLYLPAVAIGFVVVDRVQGWGIHSIAGYFALMPMRYGGPLALALLTVWIAAAPRSRRRTVGLGAACAVTFLINVEFGLFAVAGAALAAAMLNDDERPPLARTARLLGELAAGAAAVGAAFALATLIRSGSLPEIGQLFYFQRQFAAAGFFMIPMDHLLNFPTLVFLTAAACVCAGVGSVVFGRVRPGIHGRRSAALLIYAGIFGFGAFMYYMGRTLPDVFSATLLSWGIALTALCWEAGCRVAAGGLTARAVRPAATILLLGATVLGVVATRHLEYAVHQPARIAHPLSKKDMESLKALGLPSDFFLRMYIEPDAVAVLRQCARPGANILALTPMPDRVAHAAKVHNWYPYDTPGSIVTIQQLDHMYSVAADHHVTIALSQYKGRDTLARHGFEPMRVFTYLGGRRTTIWQKVGSDAVDCRGAGDAPSLVTAGN